MCSDIFTGKIDGKDNAGIEWVVVTRLPGSNFSGKLSSWNYRSRPVVLSFVEWTPDKVVFEVYMIHEYKKRTDVRDGCGWNHLGWETYGSGNLWEVLETCISYPFSPRIFQDFPVPFRNFPVLPYVSHPKEWEWSQSLFKGKDLQ